MNVLLITLDQFRGDCMSSVGHPIVQTPNLDRLAAAGVLFRRHYSQSAPCSPGRAALYTGTYTFNNRVVANGTPLDARFDNLALAARRAGYRPLLFGYTDQSIDPRHASGATDPRLWSYEGVLPGFDAELDLTGTQRPWIDWLQDLGHRVSDDADQALRGEPQRDAALSVSAFLTDRVIETLDRTRTQPAPWFIHASYFRPHPPYAAAGEWSGRYDPNAVDLPIAAAEQLHPYHAALLRNPGNSAPNDERELRHLRAQYYGMVSEVDHQLGRLWQTLVRLDMWDDTLIIVTSDHGEQLGDHGLIQKLGFFEQSYHIPCIIRDPRRPHAHGTTVTAFTENVDIFATVCDALALPVPPQSDGLPLTAFLDGRAPPWWRDAAHWEFDWRHVHLPHGPHEWPWDRRLERQHLAVLRTNDAGYVHFGNGGSACFNLVADPTWRTLQQDPRIRLELAEAMLTWRSQHSERTLTGMLMQDGGIGRWP